VDEKGMSVGSWIGQMSESRLREMLDEVLGE
jgi:hypothetical protein